MNQNEQYKDRYQVKKTDKQKFHIKEKIVPILEKYRMEFLLGFVAFLFIVNIYIQLNPPYIDRLVENQRIVSEVSSRVGVSKSDVLALRQIDDVQGLRSQNSIMAEVYKSANNGDYVVGFPGRLVIYRMDSKEIIYNAAPPAQLQEQRKQELARTIQISAQGQGLEIDANDLPQLTAVADVEKLKELNASFYKDVKEGDVIAVFPISEAVVIYRPETQSIIEKGSFVTEIK